MTEKLVYFACAEVAELADLPAEVPSHGGETGRRARLKIAFPQGSVGSTPTRGTNHFGTQAGARPASLLRSYAGQATQNRVPARCEGSMPSLGTRKEKSKSFGSPRLASLRSATNSYSILGVKTNSRFRKIWFEPMFFRNVVISSLFSVSTNFAA